MRILLTNDDGITSPGLAALEAALLPRHEVWVVAPDGERSGNSHYITLRGPIRHKASGERRFASAGSPADCVIVALRGGVPQRPDLVISGINLGPNLGTDLIYSGTAAAARQGALLGVPSLAVSLSGWNEPLYFDAAADFVAKNLDHFFRLWNPDHFLNINAPNARAFRGVKITTPCVRMYHDSLVRVDAPDKNAYFFVKGERIDISREQGSDWEAVRDGFLSLSPIHVHPVSFDGEGYRATEFLLP